MEHYYRCVRKCDLFCLCRVCFIENTKCPWRNLLDRCSHCYNMGKEIPTYTCDFFKFRPRHYYRVKLRYNKKPEIIGKLDMILKHLGLEYENSYALDKTDVSKNYGGFNFYKKRHTYKVKSFKEDVKHKRVEDRGEKGSG